MYSYKLRISYDGTMYQGWQPQPTGPTVAQTILDVFHRTFSHSVQMIGASRTDSGVHALDQVAGIRTELVIDPQRLCHAWNNALPEDIVIRSVTPMPQGFHPHHDVLYKQYEYQLFLTRPLPFEARFGWWPQLYVPKFDLACFTRTMQLFVGMHDITAFSKEEPDREYVRAVDKVEVVQDEYRVRVLIQGKGFLRHQIRRMIGASVLAASATTVSHELVAQILNNPSMPHNMLLNAEARGLCLRRIVYKGEE